MIKSLYVHIPFCIKKCLYCDFNSCANRKLEDKYIDSLMKEIESISVGKFETIFIGGGTPTILSMCNLEKLLNSLLRFNPSEYTVEANPGTLTKEKLQLLQNKGVNRLSIGLQAWQDELLKSLGRIHNIDEFLHGYELARQNGFKNINIDLMFGIPGQSIDNWIETLSNVVKLSPEHLSCYSLIVEEGTPYYDMNEKGLLNLPSEDIERQMYYYAVDKLKDSGYSQYEISNFAKEGFKCKHNLTYWKDEEYIGVGAGSHSYVGNKRYSNHKDINEYIKGIEKGKIIDQENYLTKDDEISEFMFLGLRLTSGINKAEFKQRFGFEIERIYSKQIDENISKGLIEIQNNDIRLTKRGVDLSNQVFVSFLR